MTGSLTGDIYFQQMLWHCSTCVTLLKLDVFLIYCTFPRRYISEYDRKKKKKGEKMKK